MHLVIGAVQAQTVAVLSHLPDVSATEGRKVVHANADSHRNELHSTIR